MTFTAGEARESVQTGRNEKIRSLRAQAENVSEKSFGHTAAVPIPYA